VDQFARAVARAGPLAEGTGTDFRELSAIFSQLGGSEISELVTQLKGISSLLIRQGETEGLVSGVRSISEQGFSNVQLLRMLGGSQEAFLGFRQVENLLPQIEDALAEQDAAVPGDRFPGFTDRGTRTAVQSAVDLVLSDDISAAAVAKRMQEQRALLQEESEAGIEGLRRQATIDRLREATAEEGFGGSVRRSIGRAMVNLLGAGTGMATLDNVGVAEAEILTERLQEDRQISENMNALLNQLTQINRNTRNNGIQFVPDAQTEE